MEQSKKEKVYEGAITLGSKKIVPFGHSMATRDAWAVLISNPINVTLHEKNGGKFFSRTSDEIRKDSKCVPVRICALDEVENDLKDWTIIGSPIEELNYAKVIRFWPADFMFIGKNRIEPEEIVIDYYEDDYVKVILKLKVVYADQDKLFGDIITENRTNKEDYMFGKKKAEQKIEVNEPVEVQSNSIHVEQEPVATTETGPESFVEANSGNAEPEDAIKAENKIDNIHEQEENTMEGNFENNNTTATTQETEATQAAQTEQKKFKRPGKKLLIAGGIVLALGVGAGVAYKLFFSKKGVTPEGSEPIEE